MRAPGGVHRPRVIALGRGLGRGFASQTVVHLHLDDPSGDLVRIGLGNAYLVSQLVSALDAERAAKAGAAPGAGAAPDPTARPAEQRLKDAVAALNAAAIRKDPKAPQMSEASVEAAFRNLQQHGYTQFLLSIS